MRFPITYVKSHLRNLSQPRVYGPVHLWFWLLSLFSIRTGPIRNPIRKEILETLPPQLRFNPEKTPKLWLDQKHLKLLPLQTLASSQVDGQSHHKWLGQWSESQNPPAAADCSRSILHRRGSWGRFDNERKDPRPKWSSSCGKQKTWQLNLMCLDFCCIPLFWPIIGSPHRSQTQIKIALSC